jgi:hypothetical protein
MATKTTSTKSSTSTAKTGSTTKKTTTKTTAAKKTTTKKTAVESTPVETQNATEVVATTAAEPVMVQKTYATNDYILCKSVCYGKLTYISSKSGQRYEWSDYGDVCYVEYGDLLSLRAAKSKFIYEPWFIISDDYLAEQWKLAEIYSYFEGYDSIEDFLTNSPQELKQKLSAAPHGFQSVVVHTAGNMLREGRFDSIAALKAIDAVMNTKLSSLVGA